MALTLVYILKSITRGISGGFVDWTLLVLLFPFGMSGLFLEEQHSSSDVFSRLEYIFLWAL